MSTGTTSTPAAAGKSNAGDRLAKARAARIGGRRLGVDLSEEQRYAIRSLQASTKANRLACRKIAAGGKPLERSIASASAVACAAIAELSS